MNDIQEALPQIKNYSAFPAENVKGSAYDVETVKKIILLSDLDEIKLATGRTEASIKKIRFDFIHWEKGDVVDVSPTIRQAFEEIRAHGQTLGKVERKPYTPSISIVSADRPEDEFDYDNRIKEDPFAEFEIITRTYINSVADLVERMATQMYVEKVESNIQKLRDEASQINFRRRFKSVRRIKL